MDISLTCNFACCFYNSQSTRLLGATTLRNVLGTKNLAEVLADRETISHAMQVTLDEATDPWGVKVDRVEMYGSFMLLFLLFVYLPKRGDI